MATPVSPPETVSTPSGRTCQREIGATGRPGGRQATQAKRGRPQELNHARSRLASQVCLDLIWCSAQTSLQPRGLVQIRGVLNLVRSFGDRCMSLNDAVGTAFAHTPAFPLGRIGVPRLSPPERGVPRPLIDTALINGLPQVSPCHIRARGRIARSAELPKGRPPRRRLDRSVQAWIFAFPVALSQRLNSSAALPTPSDARSCLIGPGADKRPVAGRAGSQVAAI